MFMYRERLARYMKLLNTLVYVVHESSRMSYGKLRYKDGVADPRQQATFLNFFFVREYNRCGIILVPRLDLVRSSKGDIEDVFIRWDRSCMYRQAALDSSLFFIL